MAAKIMMDEWLAELDRLAEQSNAEGISTAEVAAHLGIGMAAALERVKKKIAEGAWEYAGRKAVKSIDGRAMTAPAYRPVKKPARKK